MDFGTVTSVKASVDPDKCQGHARCWEICPEVFELTVAHYGGSFGGADRERAVFYARCKLIEDLAYGVGSPGERRYAEAALGRLDWTFGDPS